MSYQYVSALARLKGTTALWQSVDLSAVDINTIYSTYQKVYLTLTNPIYTNPVYLDFDLVRSTIGVQVPGKLIPAWLAGLGNASLPTFTNAPTFTTQTARYSDGWLAGYTAQPTNYHVSPEAELPPGALNDLILTKANVDYTFMAANVMVSVNGLFHRVGAGAEGLYVVDGASTGRICNDNQMGIYSFTQIGGITQIPVTDAMIYNQPTVEPLGKFVYVNLGMSLVGKSLLFVLAGHLHAINEAYQIIGDGLVRINIDMIPWAEVFYDCLASLDMSSVTWNTTQNNLKQITVADLYSDAVVRAMMKLTQTFFVVVNAPVMYSLKHYCEKTGLPGRWQAPTTLRLPLIGPMGRVIEYVPQWENTLYVLQGRDTYDTNYNFQTTPWKGMLSIAPTRVSRKPIQFPRASLLELGVQTVVTS
jgi:hypothetical protein